MADADDRRLAEGATAVRRDVLRGKVWTAAPHRVVRDCGTELVLAYWPGIRSLVPTTWIQWLRTGDDSIRKQAIPNLAAGRWQLDEWIWQDTTLRSWYGLDPDFSVHLFTDLSGEPIRWYLNFERPYRRTSIGIDTFDLLLDLDATPDLDRWQWKDQDEYAHARHLGVIDDRDHRRVEQARQRAVTMIQTRGGPFARDQRTWHARSDWPLPILPDNALDLHPVQSSEPEPTT